MQSAPLGEYSARLDLLRAFAAQAGVAPGPGARPTAAVLSNVARLFDLHSPAVDAASAAALAPLTKQLADFVALARWEDRGYYANRAAAEKAARHLHRLGRRARAALGAPAAPVLAGAGAAMGLADLEAGAIAAAAGGGIVPAVGVKAEMGVEADPAGAASAWAAACSAAAAAAAAAPPPPHSAPRTAAVPRLTARLAALAAPLIKAVSADPARHAGSAAAADLDGLAGDAAGRALALRGETAPAARPRKKKALGDLLAALVAAGASRSVAGVPRADRAPASWMAAPGLLDGGGPAALAGLVADGAGAGASPSPLLPFSASTTRLLGEADAYYFRAVARVQRLRAAAASPHEDVTESEARAATRLCESVLWAGRRGRAALVGAAAQARRLCALAAAAEGWGGAGYGAPQPAARAALVTATTTLPRAAARLADGAALLRSAAGAERAAGRRAALAVSAAALADASGAVAAAAAALLACPAVEAAGDPAAGGTVSPAALAAVRAALGAASAACARLDEEAAATAVGPALPGWGRATRALRAAAAAAAALDAATPETHPAEPGAVVSAMDRLPGRADAAVAALLAWTQALAGHSGASLDSPDSPLPPLAAAVADAEERLRPRALRAACDALGALLADAASVADGGDDEQGKGIGHRRGNVLSLGEVMEFTKQKTLIYY